MRSKFKFDLAKDKLQCNKSIMKTVRPAVLAWEEMPYLWEKTLALPTVLQEKSKIRGINHLSHVRNARAMCQ